MTILIVDDEKYVREDLKEILTRMKEEEHLTIITAADGADGLEQALLTPPDLLITDVQMPRMNGLELAEQVQRLVPTCRTIFLSNYSDKEYLRSAIHLHAVEYIDKPMEPERLIALIRGLMDQYRKNMLEHQTREAHVKQNINNAKQILAQLWSQMLRGRNANLESLRSQCALYDMSSLFQCVYRCLLVRTTQDFNPDFTFPKLHGTGMLPPDYSEKGTVILILYSDEADKLDNSCIRSFWTSLQTFPQITGLGVGPIASDYRQVFHSWQIAQTAFNQLFFSPQPQLIFREQTTDTQFKNPGEDALKKVITAISALNLSSRELDMFFAPLRIQTTTPASDIRNYFCKTADLLLQYSAENLLDFHKHHTNFDLYQEVWAATDLDTLGNIVRCWVDELLEQGIGDDRTVRMTTAYIQKHFSDPELSLDSLCNFTGYSRSYLCTIFKRLTGTNLNAYINKIRIDNACHLLNTTDKSLKEIAAASGFSDHSYFGKVFKTITGQTPKKYRKNLS